MPDPVGGTPGRISDATPIVDLSATGKRNSERVQHQQPACGASQPTNEPIDSSQLPGDLQFSEAVKQEVAQAAIPFHEAIDRLSQQIDELQHRNAAQHQYIGQLQSEISGNKTVDGDSPGIMNKLGLAVKNCFGKPVVGLICAGLVVGALALMVTPIGLPALLVLGTLLHAAVPILVGAALGAAVIHTIHADSKTKDPSDKEVRPHEPDQPNDPPDKTNEDDPEPPSEEFTPETKPIQPQKTVMGYPLGTHAMST